MEKALAANNGREFDISINVVNIQNSEMASILPVRDGGVVYFFSMAVSFTKAALGAEGVGKDVSMIIGNGYTKDHAEITLAQLRDNLKLREIFEQRYI
jgi:L-erythro-3,5-diaminohexanoate dehydrogenase